MNLFSNKALAVYTVVLLLVAGVLLLRIPPLRYTAAGQMVGSVTSLLRYTVNPDSFRTKIYDLRDMVTPYPGLGEVRVNKPERLLLLPQTEGAAIEEVDFETPGQVSYYENKGYTVGQLAADSNYLLYTVGRFERWEEVGSAANGGDRLMVLSDPTDQVSLYTFRVVGNGVVGATDSDIDVPPSLISMETLGWFGVNPIETVGLASELSDQVLNELFRAGDTVIVVPRPPYPGLATIDENGVQYAQVVTVRRTRVPKL